MNDKKFRKYVGQEKAERCLLMLRRPIRCLAPILLPALGNCYQVRCKNAWVKSVTGAPCVRRMGMQFLPTSAKSLAGSPKLPRGLQSSALCALPWPEVIPTQVDPNAPLASTPISIAPPPPKSQPSRTAWIRDGQQPSSNSPPRQLLLFPSPTGPPSPVPQTRIVSASRTCSDVPGLELLGRDWCAARGRHNCNLFGTKMGERWATRELWNNCEGRGRVGTDYGME